MPEMTYRIGCLLACGCGFGLCVVAYYPGIASPDTLGIYRQALRFSFNDWHSPGMAFVWSALVRIHRGPESMLFLLLTLYWGALFLLATAAAQIHRGVALLMIALGFAPFAINFAGTLWTDVLLATSWLLCMAIVFSAEARERPVSATRLAAAAVLFAIGIVSRHNALFAAVPLGLYLFMPAAGITFWRSIAAAALILAGVWAANWTLTYAILDARRTQAVHSILTYDLGGISRFSGKNYFPGQWTYEEEASILSSCYSPQAWDQYAWGECKFVVERLRADRTWQSPALSRAWLAAVRAEPTAYLRHRWTHFSHFMTSIDYIVHEWVLVDDGVEHNRRATTNRVFRTIRAYVYAARGLFRPIVWLALACGCLLAAMLCPWRSRRFVLAAAASSILYLMPYLFVGVASNFRYAYWAVLATSAAAIVLCCELAAALARRSARGAGAF